MSRFLSQTGIDAVSLTRAGVVAIGVGVTVVKLSNRGNPESDEESAESPPA